MKTAFVSGVTGQDGAYLAKFLLEKGYTVYGGCRRTSTPNFWRLDELRIRDSVKCVAFDLADASNVQWAVSTIKPDEFYNLAAQSFVSTSFDQPIYTGDVDGLGVARILDAIRQSSPATKFYQASTSEMFGKVQETPQTERTMFYPRSPYGVAKLYAHWMTVNYRESYNLFAVSGIAFNHESPLRGVEFVTRKITYNLARIKIGLEERPLRLGNLDARRDWGYAKDYVKGMWLMLQQDKPVDCILSTGETHPVRSFAEKAAAAMHMKIEWIGKGRDEVGVDQASGRKVIVIDREYYRPAEVDLLLGSADVARTQLGWASEMSFEGLVQLMAAEDLSRAHKALARRQSVVQQDDRDVESEEPEVHGCGNLNHASMSCPPANGLVRPT
ncbi:GDP-mannose 4,6-dehydratase [Reyranella sp. CPCC 100927]|uniref:GDP-mannose 4,6-dehydratase n=1 Tax=Reyranella sp. CPCC 100927 TaxID=2599616 RepID=UPI0011B450CF|nr:GDP-mannose 4,6-dehydratase [Reyranella sp. CPCC 100927]TWT05687.1 GDP-mannose 4,6-dehydratase [Reyranella sp. CPCC 100927]